MSPAELLDRDAESIWGDVWKGLARATLDGRHAFRLPTIATRCPERGVRARTVVLRECSAKPAGLSFHTDRRAGKLAGLELEPRVSWCFYDPRHRVQVRAETRAEIRIADDRARAAWEKQSSWARRLYRVEPDPGTELPEAWSSPGAEEGDGGFENFALVECALEELEWLLLAREGHRRLRFREAPEGGWRATALVP